MSIVGFLSLIGPLLTGVLITAVLMRRTPLGPAGPLVLGYGLLTGLLAATLVLKFLDLVALPLTSMNALLVNAAFAAIAAACVWRDESRAASGEHNSAPAANGWLQRTVACAFLLLAALHLALAATDALVRPLFPWDATMHWATKAKVWFDQAQMVTFVSNETWLTQGPGDIVYTDHHPAYPPTVPLLQLWMALGAGFWSETIINAPWPMFGLALALIFYGESREMGASMLCASVFAYLVVSLPLLTAHIAMAGYADLPLATCYLAALLCTTRGIQTRDARRLGQGLFFALMCTQIKNEGFYWAMTLIPAAMVLVMPRRTLLYTVLAALGMLIVGLLILPADFSIAGHSLQGLEPGYREGAASALLAPMQRGTWHLLAVLALLVPFALIFSSREDSLLTAFAAACGSAIILYLILFTMTRFAYGAIHLSASSRIALHIVPAVIFLCLLAWLRICRWSAQRDRIPDA